MITDYGYIGGAAATPDASHPHAIMGIAPAAGGGAPAPAGLAPLMRGQEGGEESDAGAAAPATPAGTAAGSGTAAAGTGTGVQEAGGNEAGTAEDAGDGSAAAREQRLYDRHAGADYHEPDAGIQPYDFRATQALDTELLGRLRIQHERLARGVGRQLSLLLGTEAGARVATIGTMRVGEYREAVRDSALFARLHLQPGAIDAVWEWGAGVTFAVVERLLGGQGSFDHEPRFPTAIESGIFQKIVEVLGGVLARSLGGPGGTHELRALVGDQHVLALGAPDDVLVHIGLEVGFEGGAAPCSLAYHLHDWATTAPPPAVDAGVRAAVSRSLRGATVPVRAELGQARLTLAEITEMRVGDVIRLSHRARQPVVVRVAGEVRFTGEPGQVQGRRAVRITDVVEEDA